MKRIIYIILILLVLPVSSKYYAQQKKFLLDSSEVLIRKPSEAAIEKFRTDKDFLYTKVEKPTGLLEIISAWIKEFLGFLFDSPGFHFVSKYLSYIILILAIIIVVYILNKYKLKGVIYTSQDTPGLKINELTENIHEIDFDELVSNALRNKEYRIAVRYCYLNTLKLLTDSGAIDWKINKTNSQYIKEISRRELKQSFSELTNLFEIAWYGETAIESSFFESIREKFMSFNNRLAVKK